MTNEEHNELVEEYIRHVIADVIKAGGTFADVMVVMESVMTGTMLTLTKHFKIRPDIVSGLVESAVQRAIDRFQQLQPRLS